MTLGESELVTGLGLLLILALAGSAVAVLAWRTAVGRRAAAVGVRDGAVLRGEVRRLVEKALDARSSSWN